MFKVVMLTCLYMYNGHIASKSIRESIKYLSWLSDQLTFECNMKFLHSSRYQFMSMETFKGKFQLHVKATFIDLFYPQTCKKSVSKLNLVLEIVFSICLVNFFSGFLIKSNKFRLAGNFLIDTGEYICLSRVLSPSLFQFHCFYCCFYFNFCFCLLFCNYL